MNHPERCIEMLDEIAGLRRKAREIQKEDPWSAVRFLQADDLRVQADLLERLFCEFVDADDEEAVEVDRRYWKDAASTEVEMFQRRFKRQLPKNVVISASGCWYAPCFTVEVVKGDSDEGTYVATDD